jgi:hypothetical protein
MPSKAPLGSAIISIFPDFVARCETGPDSHPDPGAHRYPDGQVIQQDPEPCTDGDADA